MNIVSVISLQQLLSSSSYNADTRSLFLHKTSTTPELFRLRTRHIRNLATSKLPPGLDHAGVPPSERSRLLSRQYALHIPRTGGSVQYPWCHGTICMGVTQIPHGREAIPLHCSAPLRLLRLIGAVASDFQTHMIVDRLFGILGLIAGPQFIPNYYLSVKQSFTRFAATLAKTMGLSTSQVSGP